MDRNVNVIKDANGNNIVMVNDIVFRGKRQIRWDEVKEYLKQYVGEVYEIADSKDVVYIGNDFPDEYAGSKYTYSLKGTNAKAKANATQGIPELLKIAVGKKFQENKADKHQWNAKNGWYRYESRFALPVFSGNGEVERYNVFHVSILVRHANDGKMYLYDILEIEKETGNPLES